MSKTIASIALAAIAALSLSGCQQKSWESYYACIEANDIDLMSQDAAAAVVALLLKYEAAGETLPDWAVEMLECENLRPG